jgi:hypothetical protein
MHCYYRIDNIFEKIPFDPVICNPHFLIFTSAFNLKPNYYEVPRKKTDPFLARKEAERCLAKISFVPVQRISLFLSLLR